MPQPLLASQTPATPVRLVCLDLGGVLIRVCRDWEEACRVSKVELTRPLTDPDLRRRVGEASHRHETGVIDAAEFDAEVAALTGLAADRVGPAAEAWLKEAFPRAGELIDRLAAAGAAGKVWSACLSNTNPRHWRMMGTPGPRHLALDRLTWRFLSFEIGHMKPSPGIYRRVELASGLPPAEILFFDDNADNVAAARGRGWYAERIDPAGDAPGQVLAHLARYGVGV